MPNYRVIINKETSDKIESYLQALKSDDSAGYYLHNQLKDRDISQLTKTDLLQLLINTKRPQIFAENEVRGNGIDWNQTELSILGDISIATPVTIYDNGRHRNPEVHQQPFLGTLIFTPGALLRNGYNLTPADWNEIVIVGVVRLRSPQVASPLENREINTQAYYQLYERRLLPGFLYANETAKSQGKMALITIPGLGCGQFAGIFRGQLGSMFRDSLKTFLKTHGDKFSHIKVVYYDPYSECENERFEIDRISLLIRPLTKGNNNKPQLCQPEIYAEIGDDFTDYELFSFVAWDHVSWPGNDFYINARSTDDGVKAAATNMMMVMTGIEGRYDPRLYRYLPPAEYADWREVVLKNKFQIEVQNNLLIFPTPI
jgi:hypothetical protein